MHNKDIDAYLSEFQCQDEFWQIEKTLKSERQKNSPWSIHFYITRGSTEKEAVKIINEKRRKLQEKRKGSLSPASAYFWREKGLSIDDAIQRAEEWKKSIGKLPTKAALIEKYGEKEGIRKWDEYKEKIANRENKALDNLVSSGYSIEEARIIRSMKKGNTLAPFFCWESYKTYRKAVDFVTHLMWVSKGRDYEDRKNNKTLDHQFSCYGGWVEKVSPFVVGSIYNLEWLDKKENERKGTYCSKAKDQLLKEYTENSDNEIRQGSDIWEQINEIINANC